MRIGSAFPSKYLKAGDIPDGQYVPVNIDHVAVENVAGNDDPSDEKPVLYFQAKTKGMVLNKTNANVIAAVYGDETDEWAGRKILLYSTETQFQGKIVPCLRVKVLRSAPAPAAPPRPTARPPVAQPQAAATPPVPQASSPAPAVVAQAPFGDEEEFSPAEIPF